MNKKLMYSIGLIVIVLLIAFGYYTISPLFRNIRVDEQMPLLINDTVSNSGTSNSSVSPTSPTSPVSTSEVPSSATSSVAKIIGTTGHPASGNVKIIRGEKQGEKTSYVRYENFKTINGPDLYIYLANDLDAKDSVNIGRLKATEGNVNYEIPAGIDVSAYRYVLVWCKLFGVLFNSADISTL